MPDLSWIQRHVFEPGVWALVAGAKVIPGLKHKAVAAVAKLGTVADVAKRLSNEVSAPAEVTAPAYPLFHGIIWLGAIVAFCYSFGWLFWLALSVLLTLLQLGYALYQLVRIWVDLLLLSLLKFFTTAWRLVTGQVFWRSTKDSAVNHRANSMLRSRTFKSFENLTNLGEEGGRKATEWRESTKDLPQAATLEKTTARLLDAREGRRFPELQFLLSGLLKRDHLGIHDEELHNVCGSGTKFVVEAFQSEVEKCLASLLEANEDHEVSLETKLTFFKKERRSLGQSALCLSGGGSICMYHMGVIKALLDSGLFGSIRVFSGTSGGSILAAMLACKSEQELRDHVVSEKVSTDFRGDGSQLKAQARWFPPLAQQLKHFVHTGNLMDKKEFKQCCDYYYGDVTFAEGYALTRRHVSITVSGCSVGGGPKRLLLNHISSPHVTLASSVAASCALPGIMEPQSLEAKRPDNGEITAFDVDGDDGFVDGSLAADLPFERIATLFNVSNFIVSQVNFFVIPFLRKGDGRPKEALSYWSSVNFLELDIRHRAQSLSQLGLLPTFFGQSMRNVFKQKYHGDVTIVPRFSLMESVGLKAVLNPSVADMRQYISGGERACWPHVNRLRFMLRTENCLRSAVLALQAKLAERPPESRPANHRRLSLLHSSTSLNRLVDLRLVTAAGAPNGRLPLNAAAFRDGGGVDLGGVGAAGAGCSSSSSSTATTASNTSNTSSKTTSCSKDLTGDDLNHEAGLFSDDSDDDGGCNHVHRMQDNDGDPLNFFEDHQGGSRVSGSTDKSSSRRSAGLDCGWVVGEDHTQEGKGGAHDTAATTTSPPPPHPGIAAVHTATRDEAQRVLTRVGVATAPTEDKEGRGAAVEGGGQLSLLKRHVRALTAEVHGLSTENAALRRRLGEISALAKEGGAGPSQSAAANAPFSQGICSGGIGQGSCTTSNQRRMGLQKAPLKVIATSGWRPT